MKTPIALAIALVLAVPAGLVQAQTAAADPQSASATANVSFSEAQLDSLLAPVALYPDTLLSHVLIAATYPLEVVQADRWVRAHPGVSGEDAVNAVDDQDWDPSVKALVAFPDLLKRMSEDLDWTQQLGDAFLADEGRVMDHVQLLRNKAYAAGTLDKMEHVKVVREERIITIEPSVERVVYVPAYDTRVVYGDWWWAGYPPVYWYYPSSYVYVSGFYWSAGIFLGSSFYYSGCRWHDRRVVVVDRHYHPTHYSNRTVVHYRDARPWNHNPVHRRGVAYYDRSTSERFHSSRESYRDNHNTRNYHDGARQDPPGVYRVNPRNHQERMDAQERNNRPGGNTHIQPNSARDQRQGRLTTNPQQLTRQSTGETRQPSAGTDSPRRETAPKREENRQLSPNRNNNSGTTQDRVNSSGEKRSLPQNLNRQPVMTAPPVPQVRQLPQPHQTQSHGEQRPRITTPSPNENAASRHYRIENRSERPQLDNSRAQTPAPTPAPRIERSEERSSTRDAPRFNRGGDSDKSSNRRDDRR